MSKQARDELLIEIEGMLDCLNNRTEPRYQDDRHITWAIGFKKQKILLEKDLYIARLRSAIKEQLIHMENIFDVSDLKSTYGEDKWWQFILAENVINVLKEKNSGVKIEKVVKAAYEVYDKEVIKFSTSGVIVDEEKAELLEKFFSALEDYKKDLGDYE